MRVPFIAGNWKMNLTHLEAMDFLVDLESRFENKNGCEIAVCPPFTSIRSVKTLLDEKKIEASLGAQNMFYEQSGAYTGEISPLMLKALGVEYVILGHSERREYFDETNGLVNQKIKSSIANGIKPILCIGETLDIRERGEAEDFVLGQLKECLDGIDQDAAALLTIAYEPIWAIGTGKTATVQDANGMCSRIRGKLSKLYKDKTAEEIRIQYGGSVKPSNISELMHASDIDGALVGGASLKVDDFLAIINY